MIYKYLTRDCKINNKKRRDIIKSGLNVFELFLSDFKKTFGILMD
jgi:hypothetical protein